MNCTNCGYPLKGYSSYCPSCGAPAPGNGNLSATFELINQLNEIDEEKQNFILSIEFSKKRPDYDEDSIDELFEGKKINLIKTFPIPNTVEGVFEFMVLATSNFDPVAHAKNLNKKDISDAWLTKIEQAYQKATMLFGNHPDYFKIADLYNNAMKEKDEAIKQNRRKARVASIITFGVVALVAALICVIILISTSPIKIGRTEEDFLGQNIQDVVAYLENQGFENIIVSGTLNSIEEYGAGDVFSVEIDGSDDFNSDSKYKRNTTIRIQYIVKKITLSVDSSDLKGMNYKDAVKLLKDLGFTDISLVEDKDVTLGLIYSVDDVKSVQIGGDGKFKSGDVYRSDEKIIITYHGKK